MGTVRTLTIDLPEDSLRALEARVAAGDYPSLADAMAEAVMLLQRRDEDAAYPEQWLTDVVLPAFDQSETDEPEDGDTTSARLDRHMDDAIRRHKRRA